MERLGRYVLDRKLAVGGMAEVFLARQTGPGGFEKPCVVKRMLTNLSEQSSFVDMFLDEARLAARLAHPGIAQIIDFGLEQGIYFIAMERITGSTLATILQIHKQQRLQVPIKTALKLTALVAQTLDYAHRMTDERGVSMHVIHRDVTPTNIMISTLGEVKLIDFGIAKAANASHQTSVGMVKGKLAYMSPEQLRQLPIDNRTDVYSLGLVLYELLGGIAAVRGESHAALLQAAARRQFTSIEVLRPEITPEVKAILDCALAEQSTERFTAAEMAERLDEAIIHGGERVKQADLAALLHLELTTSATNPGNAPPGHNDATTIEKNPLKAANAQVPIEVDVPITQDHRRPGVAGPTVDELRAADFTPEMAQAVSEHTPAEPMMVGDPEAQIPTNPRMDSPDQPTAPPAPVGMATVVVPPKAAPRRLRKVFIAVFLLAVIGLVFPDVWLRFAPVELQTKLGDATGYTPESVLPWVLRQGTQVWTTAMSAVESSSGSGSGSGSASGADAGDGTAVSDSAAKQ